MRDSEVLAMCRNKKGSFSIEIIAMMPVAAVFIVLIMQIFGAFCGAMLGLKGEAAKADRMVRLWEEKNRLNGMARPCLERIRDGRGVERTFAPIGFGIFRREVETTPDVNIVGEDICVYR
jgi:hypothetical protein